jgi:hypothetical protein
MCGQGLLRGGQVDHAEVRESSMLPNEPAGDPTLKVGGGWNQKLLSEKYRQSKSTPAFSQDRGLGDAILPASGVRVEVEEMDIDPADGVVPPGGPLTFPQPLYARHRSHVP